MMVSAPKDCRPPALKTRQANAAMKTMPNKTDRNDARALAQIMRPITERRMKRAIFLERAAICL